MGRLSDVQKAEHRERLLEAAATEFANKGLAGARVDEISLAAGLAKGTIYNYFESKHAVFVAVVDRWVSRTIEARNAVSADGPARDRLLALLEADVAVVTEIEQFARTAFREVLTVTPDELAELMPAWKPLDDEVREIIEAGQKAGELRGDRSASDLAGIFLMLSNGMLFEHWISPDAVPLATIPAESVAYFFDGAAERGDTK